MTLSMQRGATKRLEYLPTMTKPSTIFPSAVSSIPSFGVVLLRTALIDDVAVDLIGAIKPNFLYHAKEILLKQPKLLMRFQHGRNIRQALTRYVLQPKMSAL